MAEQQDFDSVSVSVSAKALTDLLWEEIAKFNAQNMGIMEEDAMKEMMKLMDKEKTSEYLNLLREVEVLQLNVNKKTAFIAQLQSDSSLDALNKIAQK
ncbi:hypothetical protein WN944_003070 [Citrus x changshan-huyou]|uniref:Uncharacterized protein n=1 Tax=Citrus x changshan-huyou TaxID=2935761 RepID=A0AAP0M0Y0_9ROSI